MPFPLSLARSIADGLVLTLAPACDQIKIAGSIRRRKTQVKDIEIVCQPKYTEEALDLFGTPQRINLLDQRLADLVAAGSMRPGDKNGERYRTFFITTLHDQIKVDLFIVLPPAQWGVILTLRTGPADYSKWLVTSQAQGGALPNHLRINEGRLITEIGKVIDTPTEADFFNAIGHPYLNPTDRAPRWWNRDTRN